MKVYITQWVGVRDQFRLCVDVPQAVKFLRSMCPGFTLGTVTMTAQYQHVPDDYFVAGGTDNDWAYYKPTVPASDVQELIDVLGGDLSRFKGDIYLSHDIKIGK